MTKFSSQNLILALLLIMNNYENFLRNITEGLRVLASLRK